MNILHEFLVLLENEEKIPIFRFNRWGRAKAKGALGKLLALKLVKKCPDKNFQISDKGLNYINKALESVRQNRLDFLHDEITFLSLKFPETERGKRDKLRSFLKMSSFLKLGGVWIIPIQDEIRIMNYLKLNNLITDVLLIKGHISNSEILEKLKAHVSKIEKSYSNWILEAQTKLKGINNRSDKNYVAKKLIFEYSIIKKQDILPTNIITKDWIDEKARKIYLELKNYLD